MFQSAPTSLLITINPSLTHHHPTIDHHKSHQPAIISGTSISVRVGGTISPAAWIKRCSTKLDVPWGRVVSGNRSEKTRKKTWPADMVDVWLQMIQNFILRCWSFHLQYSIKIKVISRKPYANHDRWTYDWHTCDVLSLYLKTSP